MRNRHHHPATFLLPYATRRKTAALLLFFSAWLSQTCAQEPASTAAALDQYRSQRLQEKLFLHTDKQFYLAGEICWFKLYAVDAGSHRPLTLSKVAYLEWLDKDNKAVLQTKIGLSKGHGDGSVYLPLTLRSGNYKLRAYTSWMKNYGADWFFEKTIAVVNARRSAEAPAAEAPLVFKTELFPEGGNLVENISSKIAFNVRDQYGRGIECSGTITEDDQDTVVRFHTLRFGIGSFILTPRSGHRYRSTVRLPDGTAISNLLPAAYKEGTVMRVAEEGKDHFRVDIESTATTAIYLIAHTRQSVRLAEAILLRDGKASFQLDKASLGDGISHLTIFNSARQPICERLVFKWPAHPLQIAVNADKESYAARNRINLQLSLKAQDGQPTPADCSLSVFRVDSLQPVPADHIGTYLWLASDLKGKIESPDYYFDHPEDGQAMDNLMLSHGWRRFRWEDVLRQTNPSFEFPPEYNGAIISGKVVNSKTGASDKNVLAYLSVPGIRTQFSAATCDDQGRVRFELKDFYGGQEIIVQTNPFIDSLFRVDITSPFAEGYTDSRLPPFTLAPGCSTELTDKNIAVQVLNRYGGEKLKQFHFPDADTTRFYYKPDYSYVLDDYTRFTTMEEVMREYVVKMLVQKRGGHFHLPLFDMPNTQILEKNYLDLRVFDKDPLVLLDGVPIFNMDSVMTLDPLKIRKLETLQRKYFLGTAAFDGILNWTTYKGDLGGYILDPRAAVVDYEGLQLEREFYSPSYATAEETASHIPDFRNVLYWSPVVSANLQGKGELSFYSSDIPGKYIVVVEALAADGSTGSCVSSFEVK